MTPTPATSRVVFVHPGAPPKPAEGAPCNGCGVCCLAEPCPAGIVATRSTHGPCTLLRWDATASIYRCGLLAGDGRPHAGRLAATVGTAWRAIARRWIAAGRGCDCSLAVDRLARADPAHDDGGR